jgi:hypothetical protein
VERYAGQYEGQQYVGIRQHFLTHHAPSGMTARGTTGDTCSETGALASCEITDLFELPGTRSGRLKTARSYGDLPVHPACTTARPTVVCRGRERAAADEYRGGGVAR